MLLEVKKGESAIDNGSKLKFNALMLIIVSPKAFAKTVMSNNPGLVDFAIKLVNSIHRGYYTVVRGYEFYFRVAKQYFTNECSK